MTHTHDSARHISYRWSTEQPVWTTFERREQTSHVRIDVLVVALVSVAFVVGLALGMVL